MELYKSIDVPWLIPWLKGNIALSYIFNGKIDLAAQLSSEALQAASDCDDFPKRYFGALQFVYGESLHSQGLVVEAEKELLSGLEILSKYQFHSWAGAACGDLGQLYYENGDYKKSALYFDLAVDLHKKINYFPSCVNGSRCGSIMANFHINNKDISVVDEITDRYQKTNYSFFKGLVANMLGEIFLSTDEIIFANSEKWILKAIDINSQRGFNFSLGKDYALYAQLFQRKGEPSKAIEQLSKAIEIMIECGANGWVEKYEKELANIS